MFFCHKNISPISPPFLKKGDKVAILAPARWVTEDEMKPAIEYLSAWGLEVKIYNQIYSKYNQFAGTDEERTIAFQQALDDSELKAIFCARGGYGSVRVIQDLKFKNFFKSPKWIIGYSDITAFHSHVNYNVGVKTIHAPMPIHFKDFDQLKKSFEYLRTFLFGEKLHYQFQSHSLNRLGEITGILTGGNLSIIASLRGTPADIHPSGHVLFIEDLDEYYYQVDRMMMNLKYGGLLKNLGGIVVGAFSDMKDNATPYGKTIEQIILDVTKDLTIPIAFGFQAGHVKENFPLIMGSQVKLIVDSSNTTLEFV